MNLCTSCKLDFGSVSAFDAHRVGKHEYLYREGLDFDPPVYDGRRCLDTDEMQAKGFVSDASGTWRIGKRLEATRRAFSAQLSAE